MDETRKTLTCGAVAVVLAAAAMVSTAGETTRPVPRQGKDTWGWWARCGQHHNIILTNDTFDLVFVGDSITHNWESQGRKVLGELRQEFTILDLGYGGDRTENVLWRFRHAEQLKGYKAKAFMLMIGVNNLSGKPTCTPEEIAAGVQAILGDIRTAHPESKILLMGVLPYGKKPNPEGGAARTNKLIAKFADGENVIFLDCWKNHKGQSLLT